MLRRQFTILSLDSVQFQLKSQRGALGVCVCERERDNDKLILKFIWNSKKTRIKEKMKNKHYQIPEIFIMWDCCAYEEVNGTE